MKKHRFNWQVKAVDLFCGAGGLTHGLCSAGINVRLGIDLDPACQFPFSKNNKCEFLLESVVDLDHTRILPVLEDCDYSLIAGCAPCQTFSTYSLGKRDETDGRWNLLSHFGRIVKKIKPDFVTMENVPGLQKQQVFKDFIEQLKSCGYFEPYIAVVNGAHYGLPQSRQRLIVLASQLGPIELIKPTHVGNPVTVRDKLSSLRPINAGEVDELDFMHQSSALSPLNLKRIRASKPGGTWRDWSPELVADCHKKESGNTFQSVYGRMTWDNPSPTITTQFYGFGNGRFGHPQQDRALSLREGAILQGFPRNYKFVKPGEPVHRSVLGRMIGNAVPVKLGEVIGRSIQAHIKQIREKNERRK